MMRQIRRLWPLAGSFTAGCVFMIVFAPFQRAVINQTPQQEVIGRQGGVLASRQAPERTGGPLPQETQHRGPPFPARHAREPGPAVILPPVREVLPRANFSGNRTEHALLASLRKYGLVSNLPDDAGLKALGGHNFSLMAHSYLDNADIVCHRKLRMGKVENGGWEVCDDYKWRPIPPCIVYSFGINYDFSFDDDVGKVYGCDVYSFDPSMSRQPTYQRSERVTFYRYGLGGQSGSPAFNTSRGWLLHSLSNFKTMLHHTDKVIDVIKMDVESWEWESLQTMIQEGQLHKVRQLLVEYHVKSQSAKFLRPCLKLFASLERLGFRKFYITKNDACARPAPGFPIKRTKCYEVHYVNTQFTRAPAKGPGSGPGFDNYDEETKQEILE